MAAAWIAASLADLHWQARSVAPQVVAELTAAAMQGWAQLGMDWAEATATRARRANEYFILIVLCWSVLP